MESYADGIFFWSTWVGVIVLAIGVICAVLVAISSSIKEDKSNRELSRFKIEFGERLDKAVKEADQKIAEANARGEHAKAVAAKALLEQERLKSDNLSLQSMLAPRRLSALVWTEKPQRISKIYEDLRKVSERKVFIQVVHDAEAARFGHDIASVLTACGWEVKFVDELFSKIPDLAISEGIAVIELTDGQTHTDAKIPLWSALWEMNTIQGVNEPPLQFPEFMPNPPVTGVFVAIGLKPFNQHFLAIQQREKYREIEEWEARKLAIWRQGGSVMERTPDGRNVKVKPGPDGTWVSEDPSENLVVPKPFPILVFPNGTMISAEPIPADALPKK